MGYGVIDSVGDKIKPVDYGGLTTRQRSPMGERLNYLYDALCQIISRYQPDIMAIEQPFFARNAKAALAIGRAQAVAILASAQRAIPIYEYTPTQVKQRVTNYGRSSKEQIQEMVRLQLGLSAPPEPSDAADALAIALCHLRETHLSSLLGETERGQR